ncbi:DNA-binding transcriptional response regulator, NtrC family, contains REC, AAA-type ATPase, and a Fis-type DNA-binding domains [Persephonella hydrogeniphila]|uniref:DNA-binding transcriptional response regulator, NtrC family, contains REC, AAA-type ATPase, and a Fis-type DNA-binding domains n=1 Tax=Persephonella hydrogeniphila TaxID=198703 RepID=A0A285N0X1_9AQUI|nr:sigma-54 dependent transcriptional regulator [Persephonella hydrogeniphila]SNZ02573.1 DNA-binding transcriptional response regulator, NtrC family, contains REC, AAA-type ATPase, and a Fis-type DNA-binding domains [Persephonella hydrogeniphila]
MRLSPRVPFNREIYIDCQKELVPVKAENLSLLGIKIKDNLDRCLEEEIVVILELENSVSLRGKVARDELKEHVIVFFEAPEVIASTVGKYLTVKIYQSGRCPFCHKIIENSEKYCKKCGMFFDYTKPEIVRFIRDFKVGKVFYELLVETSKELEENKEFIGVSQAIKQVFALIRKYATNDYPVLIVGETGTGKELTAKAIHERSKRADKPFVVVNCAAIPENLLEAELFGYEKGAFTDAHKRKIGKIEYANGGTLFLDEIGDMPMNMQAKLLRFLEDLSFSRIGGNETIYADVRIIAATNVDLEKAVEEGRFREDLFYRLNVLTIKIPPLRERKEDILPLAKYFLIKHSREVEKKIKGFTKKAEEKLINYPWPGNVRELINTIRKAVVLSEGEYITDKDLDIKEKNSTYTSYCFSTQSLNLKENIEKLEEDLLKQAFIVSKGNISKMAKLLGISRPKVYSLMEKHKIGEVHN